MTHRRVFLSSETETEQRLLNNSLQKDALPQKSTAVVLQQSCYYGIDPKITRFVCHRIALVMSGYSSEELLPPSAITRFSVADKAGATARAGISFIACISKETPFVISPRSRNMRPR